MHLSFGSCTVLCCWQWREQTERHQRAAASDAGTSRCTESRMAQISPCWGRGRGCQRRISLSSSFLLPFSFPSFVSSCLQNSACGRLSRKPRSLAIVSRTSSRSALPASSAGVTYSSRPPTSATQAGSWEGSAFHKCTQCSLLFVHCQTANQCWPQLPSGRASRPPVQRLHL